MNEQPKSNYNNLSNTGMAVPVENQPILTEFTERLNKELQRQFETINRIQNGLHSILDKRTPEKDKIDVAQDLPDMASKLRNLQGQLETHNMMLERIFNHLSAII